MAGGAQYDALAAVYDFTVPPELLTPQGSFAAFGAVTDGLPRGAAVLDCACGPGQLAVGLALAGFAVTATDASPAMVARTTALADEHGVDVEAAVLAWEELGRRGWDERFAAVLCVGNSLTHAPGRVARRHALGAMARVLAPGGRFAVTSRNWELVRAAGSHTATADAIVERGGRRGLVIRTWVIADRWEARHDLHTAIALLGEDDRVQTVGEHLTFWPFRHAELLDDLAAAGLRVERTTYEPSSERYLVTARRDG